jgi:hypothetical protein
MTTDTNEASNTPRTDDTPRTNACPHCGAEAFELPVEGYTCGTEPWYDEVIGSCLVRSNICYSNENTQLLSELAASQAEVARLQKELDATCNAEELRQERETRKRAEAEVARLTKRPFGCKCETFREKALGDGCEECNKALVIEMLTDERDELEAEVERLRESLDLYTDIINKQDDELIRLRPENVCLQELIQEFYEWSRRDYPTEAEVREIMNRYHDQLNK